MTLLPLSIARRRSYEQGSALILVFWLLAMLGMVIVSMHAIVQHDVELTISQTQSFRARQIAEMGINFAMNPAVKKFDRAILEQSGPGAIIPMEPNESFVVHIRGEGGRMNINALLQNDAIHRSYLTRLFSLWGLTNDEADELFDNMIDWTDAGDEQTQKGWEKQEYINRDGQQTPYPFNRPFYSLDEVRLVRGFDQIEANLPDWRDYFTIYSAGKIDVSEAEAKVLAAGKFALGNTDPLNVDFAAMVKDAQETVELRYGPDGLEDSEDDVKVNLQEALTSLQVDDENASLFFGENDQTVHIESIATVGDFRKRVVLVVRNRTGNPQILAREEVPLFQ
jgi:general secretion pathway protein K